MKVGGHTIVMPGSLAANLTPKDQKKLLALFKRVLKRGKKRAAKKACDKEACGKEAVSASYRTIGQTVKSRND